MELCFPHETKDKSFPSNQDCLWLCISQKSFCDFFGFSKKEMGLSIWISGNEKEKLVNSQWWVDMGGCSKGKAGSGMPGCLQRSQMLGFSVWPQAKGCN